MKKHLIAAAVAGAFAVPAMAQVTIGGTLIYDLMNTQKVEKQDTSTAAKVTTKDTQTGFVNNPRNWTASQLQFSGTEDLGGGLKVSFVTTVDLRGEGTTGFTRDQNLALAGGFGTVRLGKFIPAAAMGYHGFSGFASTAHGSIYGVGAIAATAGDSTISPTAVAGTAGTSALFTAGSFERNTNLIQYTSPNISGLTVNVNIGQDSTDASDKGGKRETTQQGIGLGYAAGPLSAGFGMNTREMTAEGANATTNQTKVEGDLTWVGASYNLGVASISVTQVRREDKSTAASGVVTTNADVTVNGVGITVPMGAMTFNVAMYDGENKGTAAATDNTDLSGYQASVRYALSKRTTVYALIGENEIKRASGNTANASRTVSGNMIGLMHTF
jgi:predicted porin